jgi:hypothetical protein
MKRCPYCGAENPDNATVCVVDQTPLEQARPDAISVGVPRFAVWSEHEIPVSLAILSYVFFVPAGICFAAIGFISLMFLFTGGFPPGQIMLMCLGFGVFGMFWLLLSRGIRRCSRGWRTCALVITWWQFASLAYCLVQCFFTQRIPDQQKPAEFFTGIALSFAFQLWQYRVLTRPDVRDLFGV